MPQENPDLPPDLKRQLVKLYEANAHTRGTSVSLTESLALAHIVWAHRPRRTLEIGLAHAGSANAIAAAKAYCGLMEPHIALDPYQITHSSGVGLKEIERAGLGRHITWVAEQSERYLPKSIERGDHFDFVFIDGGHDIGQAVVDAFYVNQVLSVPGHLGVHDNCKFSTSASLRYLMDECRYVLDRGLSFAPMTVLKAAKHALRLGPWYVPVLLRSIGDLTILRKDRAVSPSGY